MNIFRQRLAFTWHYHFERFAPALAALDPDAWPRTGQHLWAAYRLGMYATVARVEWSGGHVLGDVAYAVSLAACGQGARAAAFVRAMVERQGAQKHLIPLADNLAPYLPQLSLELLDLARAKYPSPPALRVAVLLRCGQQEEARACLADLVGDGDPILQLSRRNPELLLLASNALRESPAAQIERLNAFWSLQGLSPVRLIDEVKPPSVGNLRPESRLPAVQGPLVSVLLTAYNAAGRVRAALRGLLQQTYTNIEILAVDDASTDNTFQVLMDAAVEDRRIRPLSSPMNVGTYLAKNFGLAHAKGEFVICHDADDWSHPLRLEIQVKPLLKDSRLAATTSSWVRIEEDGSFYARPVHPVSRLNPSSPLFRKELVNNKIGAWDIVRTGADSEFHARLKLAFGARGVRRIHKVLALGEHHPGSLMNAKETGFSADGVSLTRLEYWEAWARWHINELRCGRRPVMPLPTDIESAAGPFPLHPGARIEPHLVREYLTEGTSI